ncbi:uncharacterized protein TNCV_2415991 [Trichonephila clavipes]|nr:uncharacterized protein TNCV_2415991 [Trichonephila clavipes]
MCSNITTQHIEGLKLVSALSIEVDESCDINDTAQVSLFVRFMSHSDPKGLLGLLPLKGQTRGEDIANAVIECMGKHHIFLDKIVSISTNGAKSMTGQEALSAQTFPGGICKVMELVITFINFILAKALNHRQFKEFLFEMESEYVDLLVHNKLLTIMKGCRTPVVKESDHGRHVMSSSPVPPKTHRVGARYTSNLSSAQTSSSMSSSSLAHDSKL